MLSFMARRDKNSNMITATKTILKEMNKRIQYQEQKIIIIKKLIM